MFLVRRDKHLDHPAHLVIPADDRVKLALPGDIGEVAGIFFQSLVLLLGVGVGDPLVSTDGDQGLQKGFPRYPFALKGLGRRGVLIVEHGENQMLQADILVLHFACHLEGPIQQSLKPFPGIGLGVAAAAHLGQLLQQPIHLLPEQGRVHPHLLENGHHHPIGLIKKNPHEMFRLYLLMPLALGQTLGTLHRFL